VKSETNSDELKQLVAPRKGQEESTKYERMTNTHFSQTQSSVGSEDKW
jgi:hypothetical protein